MKNSNFSFVLATILFTCGGASFANAANYYISGASRTGNNYIGTNGGSDNYVSINSSNSSESIEFNINANNINVYGANKSNQNINKNKINVNYVTSDLYPAYYGGVKNGGDGDVSENQIYIYKSSLRGVYGGQINNNANGNSRLNSVKVIDSTINTVIANGSVNFRAGSVSGDGDVEFNNLYIRASQISAPNQVNITSGFSQGENTSGSSRYNILQMQDWAMTNITTNAENDNVNAVFAGRIQNGIDGAKREIVGNYASISLLNYEKGSVVGGGSVNNTKNKFSIDFRDNVVVLDGGVKIKNAYGAWAQDITQATMSDNLVVLAGPEILGNVYAAFNETAGTTKNNVVYFIEGEVSGIVGGGNLEKTGNTLVLDGGEFRQRVAGQIDGFENINFNYIKNSTDKNDAILKLSNTQNSSNLSGVKLNFASDNKTFIAGIGEKDGTYITSKGDKIANLAQNQTLAYSSSLDNLNTTFASIVGIVSNDFDEVAKEYNFSNLEQIDLTKPGTYYLISSQTPLTGYNDMNIENKQNSGKTVKDGAIAIDVMQNNQIYKIIDKDTYTRNLRGLFVSSDEKDLYLTGINETLESWEDSEFSDNEFNKFGKVSNENNIIFVEENARNLDNKTIFGGYSDDLDVSNNTININQNANLSNVTIIGGYSKTGNVSNNIIDLNSTDINADIILAKTDSGSVNATNELKNAENIKITGSLIVAKSNLANLENITYEAPKNLEITEDFILAHTDNAKASNNTLNINSDIKAKNIYVAKSDNSEASNNTLNINANITSQDIYAAFGANTDNNIVNFNKGEVSGVLHGGNSGDKNTLNINDIKLKAANVADFDIINFKDISNTTDTQNAALILTSTNDDTDLSDIEIQINSEKYDSSSDYGLSGDQKYYLISHSDKSNTNYKNLKNYAYGNDEKTVKDGFIAIDVTQNNQIYKIIDETTYTRNLQGMFADNTPNKNIFIIGESEIEELLENSISDKEFEKFGKSKTGNTIIITKKDIDLSSVSIGGSSSDKNTLNVGENGNFISLNKIKIKDIKNMENINLYLPDPTDKDVAITLTDGSQTDISNSNINVFIDDASKFTDGRIHLLKTANGGNIANPTPKSVNYQISALVEIPSNSLDLVYYKNDDNNGGNNNQNNGSGNNNNNQNNGGGTNNNQNNQNNQNTSGNVKPNEQTKIFNEARLAGLGMLVEGQYLIANHLDRIIPDAFSELFPYAIAEGYDKRYNTGSHIDVLGFNANVGIASKSANSFGDFTLGTFFEYGNADYDAFLDDGTKADGQNYYMGGGFFGKQENNSGLYLETTFRIGKLKTDFNGALSLNNIVKNYDFDLSSTYYAAHAGLGKVFNLNENNKFDIYAKYFHTHVSKTDTTLDGVNIGFNSIKSNKIRAGFKDNYAISQNSAIYAGAAYEYEFDANANGRFLVTSRQAKMLEPKLKGSTGIGEIGYEYKDEKFKFDIGVKGYVGKQEGISSQMAISIAF